MLACTRSAAVRLGILLLVPLMLFLGGGSVLAQREVPAGSAIYYPSGWNLVAFGSGTSADIQLAAVSDTLYTADASGTQYLPVDSTRQTVEPGVGYWVFLVRGAGIILRPSTVNVTRRTVPAGQCAMVGNPGTSASAQVIGASRVYVFSAQLNTYLQQPVVGIGRGAWACNDTTIAAEVSVVEDNNAASVNWPVCCSPTSVSLNGSARLTLQNDSPYPLSYSLLPVDETGNVQVDANLIANGGAFNSIEACPRCVEYQQPPGQAVCDQPGVSRTIELQPGRYVLHIQVEGPNITDLQDIITPQPDTSYDLCFFVRTDQTHG